MRRGFESHRAHQKCRRRNACKTTRRHGPSGLEVQILRAGSSPAQGKLWWRKPSCNDLVLPHRNERNQSGGMPVGIHRYGTIAERLLTNPLSPGPKITTANAKGTTSRTLPGNGCTGSTPGLCERSDGKRVSPIRNAERAARVVSSHLVAVTEHDRL